MIALIVTSVCAEAQAQVVPPDVQRPRTLYVEEPLQPPDPAMVARGGNPQHRILFLNRYGGTYSSGASNSSNNVQSINQGVWTIPPFQRGDGLWNDFMTCSRLMWERFDIEITDVDPGDLPHLECVVSGRPQHLGLGNNVGGISPITGNCSVIERAVSFAFAELYGANMQLLCETVAQEVSHSLGLDHEFLCQDPMTYLTGCGVKWFQDEAAQCGEYEPRNCRCGYTQNSVQALLARLGTSDPIPPSLTVRSPLWMASVPPAFPIEIDVSDNRRVARVEVWADGEVREVATNPPYTLHAPFDLPLGPQTLEVHAVDGAANVTKAQLMVTIEAECGAPADCPEGDCVNGRCGAALGDECSHHIDCASGVCARPPGTFSLYCGQACDEAGGCPAGTTCVAESNMCWGETGGGGGGGDGCSLGGGPKKAFWIGMILGFVVLAAAARRRR